MIPSLAMPLDPEQASPHVGAVSAAAVSATGAAGDGAGQDGASEDAPLGSVLGSACPGGPCTGDGAAAGAFCSRFHHAVELVGRRWTGVVLRAMLRGATRFSDIRAAVPTLSDKMLAERLKELEAEGVVTRTVVPSTPVRVEYALTEKGRALDAVVEAVAAWAGQWVAADGRDVR